MTSQNSFCAILDPFQFARVLWPGLRFYSKQEEVIESVQDSVETYVPAGNMLGKDFVAAFIALHFFLTRQPCRVVTTSADYAQLESVLWGEIRRFIETARYPLESDKGGPLIVNHLHLRKVVGFGSNGRSNGKGRHTCPISYLVGRVAAKGEGMLGHHVADVGDGILGLSL
jgi:hypothetical protein